MSERDIHEAAWNEEAIERLRVDLKDEKMEHEDKALLVRAAPATPRAWTAEQLGKLFADLTILTEEDLEIIDRALTPGTPEYEFVNKLTVLVRERLQKLSKQENQT